MASPSTSGSSLMRTSSSEDLKQVMDLRKRKRMESNRESARRSRMRKQKLQDDLTVQISDLTRENSQIVSSINITSQLYMSIEAENSILRAQMAELESRLQSLNEIVDFVNSGGGGGVSGDDASFVDPWNVASFMASPEMIMY